MARREFVRDGPHELVAAPQFEQKHALSWFPSGALCSWRSVGPFGETSSPRCRSDGSATTERGIATPILAPRGALIGETPAGGVEMVQFLPPAGAFGRHADSPALPLPGSLLVWGAGQKKKNGRGLRGPVERLIPWGPFTVIKHQFFARTGDSCRHPTRGRATAAGGLRLGNGDGC